MKSNEYAYLMDKLDRILFNQQSQTVLLRLVLAKENVLMHASDEIVAAAKAASSQAAAMIASWNALQQKVNDILSGVTLPDKVQADLDAAFDIDTATAASLATAINTTPAGTPAPLT